jgi:type IV pilus assembly protein PilA
VLADGSKNAITEYWTNNGSFGLNNTSVGLPLGVSINGKYTLSVTNVQGLITAKMKPKSVAKGIESSTLIFSAITSTGSIKWKCSSALNPKYLPSACRAQ